MILGGVNASVGVRAEEVDRETFKGSARRAYFRSLVQRLPAEWQLPFNELLEWVVFRDELPFLVTSITGDESPSFGKIQIGTDLVEATVANDTLILTDSESGSSDHLQISKAAAKTVDWLLFRAS